MKSDTDTNISEEAVRWVKSHASDIVDTFAGAHPSVEGRAMSIFMAGSPGAGKTEFSRRLVSILKERGEVFVRIDPDEIREFLPMYLQGRAELFNLAVTVAVEKIHHYVLAQNKNFLLDGTSAKLDKLKENIQRSLKRGRFITIEYVYQDPLVAWEFTLAREAVEGRNIPKEAFIKQFFAAYENVDKIKKEFGGTVEVDVLERNIRTKKYDFRLDVRAIAEHIAVTYTRDELKNRL